MRKKLGISVAVSMSVAVFIFLLIPATKSFTILPLQGITETTPLPDDIKMNSTEHLPDILTVEDESGHKLDLVIKDIPLYQAYLETQEDIKTEIERTQLEVLNSSTQEQLILLKYNCGNKQCSTILVKESESKFTSIALVDGIFQDYKISPEQNVMLLRYGYSEGGEIVRHILIAVDLLKMNVIPFESNQLAKEYISTPTWPIADYQWIENDRFTIEVADLESAQFEAIKGWYASNEKKTKRIDILLSHK